MLISNSTILTPTERLQNHSLRLENGRIQALAPAAELQPAPGEETLDAHDLLLAPGFIDLQLNGGFGHDFTQQPQTIWQVGAQLPRHGVTAFLPTIITSPAATIVRAQQALAQAPPSFHGAWPLGLHLEGPFLNPHKKGAHNPDHLRLPESGGHETWSADSGIRLVTLAPELPGAQQLIHSLSSKGVVVSAGHSLATYEEAVYALQSGIRYGTHLFNAMPPLHHRRPGLGGALLDSNVTVGLIADGIHVDPALVRLVWHLLGPRRLTLVTDAMAALGMEPGRYELGDLTVEVNDERATLAEPLLEDTLAGSILSLDQALRNLQQFSGCSLAEALQTVTLTPATLLGLERKGRIAPGYDADLVLMTSDLEISSTFVAGKMVYDRTNRSLS
jgi:N-acetylglucosamine-6-phosphate deacetylase